MKVPIGMLITSARYNSDKEAELFGFWYYGTTYVPSTIEEKKLIFSDLVITQRCIQLLLKGTFQQILDLIMQSDRYNSADEKAIKHFTLLADGMVKYKGRDFSFDDVGFPKGTGLTVDTECEIDETMESLKKKIAERGDKVKLQISGNWSWSKDFLNTLRG